MARTDFIFANKTDVSGLVVDVPAGIRSKTALLQILGAGLRFPDYYGVNWDACEECIRDLSWLQESNVTIRHTDLPLAGDAAAAKTYLAILNDVVGKLTSRSPHRLVVVFPPGLQTEIESLSDQ